MLRRITLFFAAALVGMGSCATTSLARAYGRIEGRLYDYWTGAPVVGAVAQVLETERGALSDSTGFFEVTRIVPGRYTLRISHLNYVTLKVVDVDVKADAVFHIEQRLKDNPDNFKGTMTVYGTLDETDKYGLGFCTYGVAQEIIHVRTVLTKDSLLAKVEGIPTMSVDPERAKFHPLPHPPYRTIPDGSISFSRTVKGRRGEIRGYLLDKETGTPIADASIILVGTTFGTTSDEEGYFEICHLYHRLYTLHIAHLNYEIVEIPNVEVDNGYVAQITLRMIVESPDLKFPLDGKDIIEYGSGRLWPSVTDSVKRERRPTRSRLIPQTPHSTNRNSSTSG